MSLDLYTRFVVALVAILALLAAFAWLVRRYGAGGRTMGGGKRRLVLVRRDGTEHLVLLGSESALLIESGIAAPPAQAEFAALVEGAKS